MRARMQKMMGAIQGKDSPDMDDIMESIKAEEQVKVPILCSFTMASRILLLFDICGELKNLVQLCHSGCCWRWKKEKVWQPEEAPT